MNCVGYSDSENRRWGCCVVQVAAAEGRGRTADTSRVSETGHKYSITQRLCLSVCLSAARHGDELIRRTIKGICS